MTEVDDMDDFAIEPSASGRLLCGGCAPDDACRLGVEVAGARDGVLWFDVTCARSWCGGPEVAHGGWIAAVFDDVLSMAALRTEPRLVTRSLTVEYLRPVPVERPLTVLARVDAHHGRRWEVSARMTLATADPALAATGQALATARAELRTRRPDHFARHQDWLAHQPTPQQPVPRRPLPRQAFPTES
ncbi:PaaI family thioesterase [Streptomyces sp. S465]|uniref:PaaI family thioesterase n=1 Tax=Streptomyces sp. S465 TaxID=2979468 RepID=UPI0022A832CB|nr:PaaI family thioesterase [Streptomyces sp. S465]WAP60061.1 PaaI family thioesterase [Streptomyces sp. S465]